MSEIRNDVAAARMECVSVEDFAVFGPDRESTEPVIAQRLRSVRSNPGTKLFLTATWTR